MSRVYVVINKELGLDNIEAIFDGDWLSIDGVSSTFSDDKYIIYEKYTEEYPNNP